jgi:hypothetical protein
VVEQPTSDEQRQQMVVEATARSVLSRVARGENPDKIIQGLQKTGWPPDQAYTLVQQAQIQWQQLQLQPEFREQMAGKYKRRMVYGVLWTVGGTVVTVGTLLSAASRSGGGTYFIAWGAIIFGIVDFIRGLVGWLKYRQ